MSIQLNQREERLFRQVGEIADQLNYPAYVIGGFVRDKMLGLECKDIDVVCQGSGIELAKKLSASMNPQPYVSHFKNFGTAMLRVDDLEVEFVGARKESYRRGQS